jgi:hypothetical protein
MTASVRHAGVTGKRGDRMATEYQINGVTYLVDAVFLPKEQKTSLCDRLMHYISNHFTDLTNYVTGHILNIEYVLTAGKEESCSQPKKAIIQV